MLSILLTIMLMDADSVKVKPTTHPTYNAMAYNMEMDLFGVYVANKTTIK